MSSSLVQWHVSNLVFWNGEGMRVCPSTRPSHRESSKVRYLKCLRNVNPGHGAGTFNQDVCTLTCFPCSLQKVIDPPAELEGCKIGECSCGINKPLISLP